MPTAPAKTVTHRALKGGCLLHARAAFELESTDDHVVLHLPVGSPGYSRDGRRDGPRNGFLRPQNFAPTFSPVQWRLLDLVIVYRHGDGWSTWRWRDGGRWTDGAYLNIERPWTQTAIGWDTEDLTLDVVVEPDGSVIYKDEDELAWASQMGVYSVKEAEAIRETGRQVFAHASGRAWPLDADWDQWIPTGTGLPSLSPDWRGGELALRQAQGT